MGHSITPMMSFTIWTLVDKAADILIIISIWRHRINVVFLHCRLCHQSEDVYTAGVMLSHSWQYTPLFDVSSALGGLDTAWSYRLPTVPTVDPRTRPTHGPKTALVAASSRNNAIAAARQSMLVRLLVSDNLAIVIGYWL